MPVRLTSRQVVEELKCSKREGCGHLLELYQERLLSEATGVFNLRREDAEEVVSDVLLAVVRGIQSFSFRRGDGDFHFWVMAIFRNRVRDFVRHAAVHGGLLSYPGNMDADGVGELTSEESQVVTAVVVAYESELRDGEGGTRHASLEAVSAALDRLEAWERVLLRCRALDIPYAEIAAYTGKSVSQLKVYHARVKRKFMIMLQEIFKADT